MSRIETPLNAGIFSLLDHKVVDAIRAMPERNRYFPGLRAYAGFRQTGIEVERAARFSGTPRVTLGGLFKLAMDGMFAFSTAPLKFVFGIGVLVCLGSLGDRDHRALLSLHLAADISGLAVWVDHSVLLRRRADDFNGNRRRVRGAHL